MTVRSLPLLWRVMLRPTMMVRLLGCPMVRLGSRSRCSGVPPKPGAKRPLDSAMPRKLERTLYRLAKQQPERRFTLLYDKVCRQDILQETRRRVKSNEAPTQTPTQLAFRWEALELPVVQALSCTKWQGG